MPWLGNPHCFKSFLARFSVVGTLYVAMVALGLSNFSSLVLADQVVDRASAAPKAGEAFVTRFSGVETIVGKDSKAKSVLKLNGVVGSLIDIRNPLALPMGQHWANEPQRLEVLASETGQVFGIAFDDAMPPNIYVSATSAFGLHWSNDENNWALGMWGKGGGPGTIYKLNGKNNYAPEVFAQVRLQGRNNTGPALGNLAYDSVSKQLFVSDLETGMIHRFDIVSGKDLGHYDHGVTGRSRFFDVQSGKIAHLKTDAFKPDCVAQVRSCKGDFSSTPSCWNYASGDRRVWGLDIRTMPDGSRRLFYATWGSIDSSDGVNGVWSVGIDKNGGFAIDKIAREFIIPPLIIGEKIAFSAPSDLSFSTKGDLLIGERGAPRNYLGKYFSPFARPTISRSFEYRLGLDGRWIGVGKYDVGNRSSGNDSRSRYDNSAGGVAWGFGYDKFGRVDHKARDQFVWLSGDSLCSEAEKCFDLAKQSYLDGSHVVGIEGRKRGFWRGNIDKSFKIDSDINVDKNGYMDARSLVKNDDSQGAGDVEIYQGKRVAAKVVRRKVLVPSVPKVERPIKSITKMPLLRKPTEWAKKIVRPKAFAAPVPKVTASKVGNNGHVLKFKVPLTKALPTPVISAPKLKALPVPKLVAPVIIVLPKEKPAQKASVKKPIKTKQINKRKTVKRKVKPAKARARKKIKRARIKRRIKTHKKRKLIRKKRRHRKPTKAKVKTSVKVKSKCTCKCDCRPIKNKPKGLKRVLHPSGKVDYTGANKVKLFVPSRP